MSYTLACGDVMPGCGATFAADSEDENLAKAAKHVNDDHGIADVTPEMVDAVKGAIKPA